MRLESIKILNFRNYNELQLQDFGETNILIGENGSGKTNFIEAVYMLCQYSPLRNVTLQEMIRWNQEQFYLSGQLDGDRVEIGYSIQKKILKMNQNPASVNDLQMSHPAVAFLPDDLFIVTGSPEDKRHYIDQTIASLDGQYRFSLLRYQKVLRQRNAQLKISPKQAGIWDEELTEYGSHVIEKRLRFIQKISGKVKGLFQEFYGEDIDLTYRNTFRIENNIKESYKKALESSRQMEQERRNTMMGPHRDSFEINSGRNKAAVFASQGQRRFIALVLKLAGLDSQKEKPVLLFDDVLLELDSARREKLLEMILPDYQIFFTAAGQGLFEKVKEGAKVFTVRNGSIKAGD